MLDGEPCLHACWGRLARTWCGRAAGEHLGWLHPEVQQTDPCPSRALPCSPAAGICGHDWVIESGADVVEGEPLLLSVPLVRLIKVVVCGRCLSRYTRAAQPKRHSGAPSPAVRDALLAAASCHTASPASPAAVCELQYSKATSNPARWVLAVPESSPVMRAEELAGTIVASELVQTTKRWGAEEALFACISCGAAELHAGLQPLALGAWHCHHAHAAASSPPHNPPGSSRSAASMSRWSTAGAQRRCAGAAAGRREAPLRPSEGRGGEVWHAAAEAGWAAGAAWLRAAQCIMPYPA